MNTRRAIASGAIVLAVAVGAVGAGGCGGSSGSSSQSPSPTADVSPAGDIPDTQAFIPFTPASGGYTVKVPEGWARTDAPTGATFTDKLNTIQIEAVPAATAPTVASVRADDVTALMSSVPSFALGTVTTAHRTAGDSVLLTYRRSSAPDPVTGKTRTQDVERHHFWRNGTLVTITLTSPKGADNVDPWKTVTDSFAWTP